MMPASTSNDLVAIETFRRLLQGAEAPDLENWVPKRYGYTVGTINFLVAERIRSEVVQTPAISLLPHCPEWLLGLMNLRGNLVPVIDLRSLCGEGPSRRPATVLVLDSGEKAVAIPIDTLPVALTDLAALDDMPPLPPSLQGHADRAFTADGRTWLAFEHDEFFRALARGHGVHP